MGAPLYGQSFSLAERNEHGLNVPTYGGGEAGEATRARGFLSYYEVRYCFRIQENDSLYIRALKCKVFVPEINKCVLF